MKESCLHVVSQVGGYDFFQYPLPQFIIVDGKHCFDSPVKVAGHPIGARQVNLRVVTGSKDEYPTVFQKAVDDTAYSNVLGKSLHSWPKTADASHNQIDRYPSVTGPIKGFDYMPVDQGI